MALASYALYTVLLRKDAGPARAPRRARARHGDGVWGTAIMLPWLAWEAVTGTIEAPADARGIMSILVLALVVTAPTLVLFNYGAERLPGAVSGVATAAIPALGYGFALLLGERSTRSRRIGGAIALMGVVIATLAAPDVEPSPPGSACPSLPSSRPTPRSSHVSAPGRPVMMECADHDQEGPMRIAVAGGTGLTGRTSSRSPESEVMMSSAVAPWRRRPRQRRGAEQALGAPTRDRRVERQRA